MLGLQNSHGNAKENMEETPESTENVTSQGIIELIKLSTKLTWLNTKHFTTQQETKETHKTYNKRTNLVGYRNNYFKYTWPKYSNKRQKWTKWIFKNHPTICRPGETHFKLNNTGRTRAVMMNEEEWFSVIRSSRQINPKYAHTY